MAVDIQGLLNKLQALPQTDTLKVIAEIVEELAEEIDSKEDAV